VETVQPKPKAAPKIQPAAKPRRFPPRSNLGLLGPLGLRHGELVERLLEIVEKGLPLDPMLNW
jgi:hypothetical protein